MKSTNVILIILLIVVVVYFLFTVFKKQQNQQINNYTTNYGSGYELGLNLANLISNTKCGKEGRPPCTKKELEAEGWSPEQIAAAEQASLVAQQSSLCLTLGIGC